MAGSAILSIKIITDAAKAQAGLGDAEKSATGFASKLNKGSLIAAGALTAVGAAAMDAAKAAADDERAQAILANTLHKAAGATDAQVAATEDWISKTAAATGVADDQLRPALANLVRATGDVTKSQDAMGVALDVAAATGQDVETVTKAMAKGYAGNTKALGKLVPGMNKAVLASGDMNKVMGELQRTTGGAAAAAADTAAGRFERFKLAMSETKESAGAALLPVLTALGGVLVTVGNFAQQHSTAFVILAAAIAGIAAAVMLANAAITIYTTVTTIAGIVSEATWLAALGPIGWVIAAILLVVGVIVLLWNKCAWFRNLVLGMWAAIKAAASATASWFVSVWTWAVNAASAVGRWFASAWAAALAWVRNAAASVIGWLRGAWAAVWGAITGFARSNAAILAAVWGGVKAAWNGALSALLGPWHAIEGAINSVISAVQTLIGWLGRIHVPSISLPHIPGINAATASGVGGGGFRAVGLRGTGAANTAATTSTSPTIVIQGAVDPEGTARQIRRILSGHDQRVGLTGVLRTA